jgi:phosphotriesterase-related protein
MSSFMELAKTGCYLEQDLFGWETSYYPIADLDMPNDAIRLNRIIELMSAGFGDQILVSQDIDTCVRLTKYGGEGYEHLLENVVPVMKRKGFSEEDVSQIMRVNPQRALTIPS